MASEESTRKRSKDEILRSIAKFVIDPFDYVQKTDVGATQEVYTYKQGGENGTLVTNVIVDYNDTDKEDLNFVYSVITTTSTTTSTSTTTTI